MAAQKGRDFILKIGTAGAGTTVASMRTTSFTVNGELVDATTKDDSGIRVLLPEGGVSSVQISATGILAGEAQAPQLLGYALDRSLNAFAVVFDDGDSIEADFQLSQFQAAGEYNKEQTYSLTLESSGAVTVTSA